jgi:hypothetical protein
MGVSGRGRLMARRKGEHWLSEVRGVGPDGVLCSKDSSRSATAKWEREVVAFVLVCGGCGEVMRARSREAVLRLGLSHVGRLL